MIFMLAADGQFWHPGVREPETAQNEPESPDIGNRAVGYSSEVAKDGKSTSCS
jgi:hypothetical protein